MLNDSKIIEVTPECFNCGYMDKQLPPEQCYLCHCGTCPDLVLSDSAKETVLQLGWDYFKT